MAKMLFSGRFRDHNRFSFFSSPRTQLSYFFRRKGPLEILGRRLGHRPFPETLPPSQQRIGAAGDLVQSREEEDGVMLGGSDEEGTEKALQYCRIL